jgi:hypothetical protein
MWFRLKSIRMISVLFNCTRYLWLLIALVACCQGVCWKHLNTYRSYCLCWLICTVGEWVLPLIGISAIINWLLWHFKIASRGNRGLWFIGVNWSRNMYWWDRSGIWVHHKSIRIQRLLLEFPSFPSIRISKKSRLYNIILSRCHYQVSGIYSIQNLCPIPVSTESNPSLSLSRSR